MNSRTLVDTYKQDTFETTSAKSLAENCGFRLRQTAKTKRAGDVWEFAATYFYTSQNETLRYFKEFKDYAAKHGFEVEAGYLGLGEFIPAGKFTSSDLFFQERSWPAFSWAIMHIRISIGAR